LDCTDVNFLLVNHYHHLPLVFVSTDTSELGTSEHICAHVLVGSLWLSLKYGSLIILLIFTSFQQLIFNLSELHAAVVFTHLVPESDQHWGIVIVLLIIDYFLLSLILLVFRSTYYSLDESAVVCLDGCALNICSLAQDRVLIRNHVHQTLLS